MSRHVPRRFLVFLLILLLMTLAASTALLPAVADGVQEEQAALEPAATEQPSGAPYEVKEIEEEWTMQDGIKLPVRVLFPATGDKGLAFPLIVFVHPLGFEEHFYEITARKYAAKGYVSVIYGIRGSFGAEGRFNIIDPAIELPDLSQIITLASQDKRFPVLSDDKGPVVGVTGYSMGGVHAYLIAPRKNPRPGDPGDPRVRAVIPMHGGADLLYSILPNDAPGLLVGGIITAGCFLQNFTSFALNTLNIALRPDMAIWDKFGALMGALNALVQQPVSWVDDQVPWAVDVFMRRDTAQYEAVKHYIGLRSARYWCDEEYDGVVEHPITCPTLIITGWNDDAFYPNQGLRILSTCMDAPGRMIITNHGHIAGYGKNFYIDIPGNPEYDWVDEQMEMWFDHYLKGIDNGAEMEPKVSFYRDRDPEHYGEASDYPLPGTTMTPYYFDSGNGGGQMSTQQPGAGSQPDFLLNIGVTGSITLPCFQDFPQLMGMEPLQIPKKIDLFDIPYTECGYLSEPLAEDMTIMGAPQLEVYYQCSQPFTQLDSFLYEVTPDGKETLISRGWYEGYDPELWSTNDTAAKPIEMLTCYHRFQAGSRVKLELATADLLTIWPVLGLSFILLHHSEGMPSRIVLPIVPNTY